MNVTSRARHSSYSPACRAGAEGKEVNDDNDDFEQADAAASAALEYARSLPPGVSLALRLLRKLASCGVLPTDYGPPSLLLAVAGLNR
jgi:hypothetical protein